MNKPIFINSSFTGGHYALKTEKSDKPFENPMFVNSKIKLTNNDIVVDIGAYVGEYSMWASKFAKFVYAYEPTPDIFNILQINSKPNIKIYKLAVVGNDDKSVRLYLSKGIGVTNSIIKIKKNYIDVPTIKYEEAVKKATVVKIDVEGAEYTYNIVQPSLRAIALEFHPLTKKPWRVWAEKIMDKIEKNGFKPIYRPNFKSGWSLTGAWEK